MLTPSSPDVDLTLDDLDKIYRLAEAVLTGFAVLAHDDPQLLGRLVRRLSGSPVAVHVDARVDLEAFEDVARVRSLGYASYAQRRVVVNWGGYSVVEAMIEAGEGVRSSLAPTDHLVFVSGRCYPLRELSRFQAHLLHSSFVVHARAHALDDAGRWHRARYERRHGFDGISASLGDRTSALRRVARRAEYYARAFRPAPTTRLRPAAGSQWTAIPAELFSEAVSEFQGPDYAFLRDGYAPDEMAFQTYIYNSRWSAFTEFGGLESLHPPRKISQLRNFHVLDEAMNGTVSHETVLNPDPRSYFARKFDSARDGAVLDILDRAAGI